MPINRLFQDFVDRIKPTAKELEKARSRRNYLENRVLSLDIGVFEVKNSGSYAKGTSIHPMKDIDIVFYINIDKYPRNNLGRILNHIARELRPSYPNNRINPETHSVKLHYTDGFILDIVPALCEKREVEGAEIIDRRTGNWIKTSIRKHRGFANRMNKIDGRYKNLVRFFKVWKEQRRRNYPSFLMDLLVAHIVKDGLPNSWEQATYKIFKTIHESKLNKPIYFTDYHQKILYSKKDPLIVIDPANPRNNVTAFMDLKMKNEFINTWENSYRLAKNAVKSKTKKDKVEYWRRVFGNRFPSR